MFSILTRGNADTSVIKLLKELGISIAPAQVEAELEKHPDYPSLMAISDVLTNFNVENIAFRAGFDELDNEICPFLAHTKISGSEFVVVKKIDNGKVILSGQGLKKRKLDAAEFKQSFAGVVLTVEPSEQVSDSNLIVRFARSFIIAGLVAALSLTLVFNTNYFSALTWQVALVTLFKSAGLVTSILLLVQSIDSNNPLVMKLCRTGNKNNDCNVILSSKAAKVFSWLSWSEVGFFYFASTGLMVLFGGGSPLLLKTMLLLNVVSLPYTFYSIYYQARVAKQWCILCCTVQALLWLEFIPQLIQNLPLSTPLNFTLQAVSVIIICLLVPTLLWVMLKSLLLKLQQLQPLKEQLRKFKYNREFLDKLLVGQPKYALPEEDWSLILGNVEAANIITMVTNPYCPPCAKTHKMLDELLDYNDNVQARIVFTADNTDNDRKTPVSRHMMALYKLADKTIVKNAMHDWYEEKQKNYDTWAKAYPVQMEQADFYKLDKQKAWCSMAEVKATPTLLLNGHVLPQAYQLSDLKYMLE